MEEAHDQPPGPDVRVIATQAAQWGADQRGAVNEAELQKARDEELRAIIHWLITGPYAFSVLGRSHNNLVHDLRAARRPKPPTRKEALEALERMQDLYPHMGNARTIRRALEALND
jgi:hypothetical protein